MAYRRYRKKRRTSRYGRRRTFGRRSYGKRRYATPFGGVGKGFSEKPGYTSHRSAGWKSAGLGLGVLSAGAKLLLSRGVVSNMAKAYQILRALPIKQIGSLLYRSSYADKKKLVKMGWDYVTGKKTGDVPYDARKQYHFDNRPADNYDDKVAFSKLAYMRGDEAGWKKGSWAPLKGPRKTYQDHGINLGPSGERRMAERHAQILANPDYQTYLDQVYANAPGQRERYEQYLYNLQQLGLDTAGLGENLNRVPLDINADPGIPGHSDL